MKKETYMKRDMELVRLILLKIEEEYRSTAIYDLKIDGYDMETTAYHCKILHEAGLISDYGSQYADGQIWSFGVGCLTWEGNDFLDKIRDNSQWKKVKDTITQKGLPLIIETIKTISTAFVTASAEGVANSILKNINCHAIRFLRSSGSTAPTGSASIPSVSRL
ncbi:MAG: DUF2513 domain-containing protein [Christensenellales bacterium]